MEKLKHIAELFDLGGAITGIAPFGSGHINDTYKVETTSARYLLQRVNHEVFKDVAGLTANLVAVTAHLRERSAGEKGGMQVLNSVPAHDGMFFHRDDAGNYWRVLDFIGGSHSYDRVPGERIAREGGRAYGWFVRMLHDFPAEQLVETIPGFHDAGSRIPQFERAVSDDAAGRLGEVQELADALLGRASSMMRIHALGKAGDIPVRVTHNDTKINNVLFNDEERGICVIDLDTVMPGYIHFDFGDAVRTFANTSDEDEKDPGKVAFSLSYFTAFAGGFLSEVDDILVATERETLALAPLYITYEQTIRFLGDYLQGDTYYKTRYPGHNLVRAHAQFALLEQMEAHLDEMKKVVRNA